MKTSQAELVPANTESVVSRFNPFSTERRALVREVKDILNADHAEQESRSQHALDAMSEVERAEFEAMKELADSLYSGAPVAQQVKSMLFRFSNNTLHHIIREFGDGNSEGAANYIKNHADSGDIALREALAFRRELSNSPYTFRLLDDLRVSHKAFMLEDLSEIEGETRKRASAVLTISSKVCAAATADGEYFSFVVGGPVEKYGNRKSDPEFRMAPVQINVIFDHLDRVDDITLYMEERLMNRDDVDAGHLREYLELPAKSLGNGVL